MGMIKKKLGRLQNDYRVSAYSMEPMKRPIQEKIILLLAFCVFQVSCGDPDNSAAERGDATTSLNEEATSINLEKRSEDSLEKKPAKSLEEAVVEGDFEVVRAYIEAGSDLNRAVSEDGSTALVMAVTFDHTEISLLLIESGADLEVKIDDGSTVLHAAAFYGRLEIVRALLDKGVNTSARTNDGSTALSIVMMPFDELMPFYKMIEGALAPAGFEIDYDLLKKNRPKIAKMLQESGGDASSNAIKAELVGNAVVLGNKEEVKKYLAEGMNLNQAVNEDGSTALQVAAVFDRTEIALLLIENGADIEVKKDDGATALHVASFFGRVELVKALLEKGADKTVKTNDGATALDGVSSSFEEVRPVYEFLEGLLAPVGFKLDYGLLQENRPKIAEMLRAK